MPCCGFGFGTLRLSGRTLPDMSTCKASLRQFRGAATIALGSTGVGTDRSGVHISLAHSLDGSIYALG
jgi:hypothetical protein